MPNDAPLYVQILNHLKDKINNKHLLPGQQLPTEMELAVQFGVSRITSKKALEELEKEGLIFRKRGLGSFVSFSAARSVGSGMGKVISIIFPYAGVNGWVMSYIKGAMSCLAPKGYYLSIHCTEGNEELERSFLKELPNSGVGGIIYYPANTTKNIDILTLMCFNKYPIVTIDKYFEGIPLNSVVADNFAGEYMLAEHMIKLGHRRIAYLASEDIGEKTSLRDRYLGYCKALRDNGILIDFEIASTGYLKELNNPDSESKQMQYLKKKVSFLINLGVTAILSENDIDAILMSRVLSEMNINIPKDISLAGFDNIELLNHLKLSLTTVNQNFYEVGRRAAELVVGMIEGNYEFKKVVVPIELIVRDTTGAVSTCNDIRSRNVV